MNKEEVNLAKMNPTTRLSLYERDKDVFKASIVYDFDISQMPGAMQEEDLKKMCSTLQVLEVSHDRDAISNASMAKARLRVRDKEDSAKVGRIVEKLKKIGCKVESHHRETRAESIAKKERSLTPTSYATVPSPAPAPAPAPVQQPEPAAPFEQKRHSHSF